MDKRESKIRFGKNLAALMTLHDIPQNRMARRLGVSAPQIMKYLSGADYLTLPRLWKIADIFGVTLDSLVGRTPYEPIGKAPGTRTNSDTLA